jgi:hypothetical protein
VALELDGNRSGASALFTSLGQSFVGPAWIRRWSWLRLADIAVAQSRPADARRALTRVQQGESGAPLNDVDFQRFADYVRRAVEWLERHPSPKL